VQRYRADARLCPIFSDTFTQPGTHSSLVSSVTLSPDGKLLPTLLVSNDWVLEGGLKFLWLPPDYRPTCVAAWNKSLVLGNSPCRVSIIRFKEESKVVYSKLRNRLPPNTLSFHRSAPLRVLILANRLAGSSKALLGSCWVRTSTVRIATSNNRARLRADVPGNGTVVWLIMVCALSTRRRS
jgi:hypothetical protein